MLNIFEIANNLTGDDNLPSDDPSILTCWISSDNDIEIVVRVVTSQDVEDIATSDKKRRETLLGTSAILFILLDDEDEDSAAYERLNGLVSFKTFFVSGLASFR